MKISTEIWSIANITGEEKAIELVAQAGFDAWDFSMFEMCRYDRQQGCIIENNHPLSGMDYLSFTRNLRRVGEDNGIVCNQTHAPFPTDAKEVRSFMKRAIECTAEVGAEICVIHPLKDVTREKNAEMYAELLEFAKPCNVKLAAENMYAWNFEEEKAMPAVCSTAPDFCDLIDFLNDDCFVACLDIGHANLMDDGTNPEQMIKLLGRRIQALHICDNDKRYDLHQIPFSMTIDFYAVLKALKTTGYSGYLTLEASGYAQKFSAENIRAATENLADSAKKLSEMFESI